VIISGANLLLTEDDVKAAKDVITSASVVICQLEIKPEVTQLALSIAKKAGGIALLVYIWTMQTCRIKCENLLKFFAIVFYSFVHKFSCFTVTTIFNPAPAQSWLDTVFYKDSDVFCANETEVKFVVKSFLKFKVSYLPISYLPS
jgi:ribokinase